MTSINNIEELVRLLDERPEWSEALRTRVLTRDLLDLPATVGQRFTQVDDQFARMSAAIERLAERTDERFNGVDERFAAMTAAIERLAERTDERFNGVDARFAQMSEAITRWSENADARGVLLDRRLSRLVDDHGVLKGLFARDYIVKESIRSYRDHGFPVGAERTSGGNPRPGRGQRNIPSAPGRGPQFPTSGLGY